MEASFLRAGSVALALGFSGAIALLIRRRFGGWASDQAMGRGACLSLLSIGLASLLSPVASVFFSFHGREVWRIWGDAFIAAALCEETARYVALLLLLRGLVTADPREFIAGAAAIGLGFGVIENLFYLMTTTDHLLVGALRGVLSAPAHLSFSFVSAFGLWSVARRKKPLVMALLFFLLAVLLHGAFDVSLMSWLDPDKGIPNDFGVWKMIGIGAAIVAAILATTVATLLVLTEFLGWAHETLSHDRTTPHTLAAAWRGFAESLKLIAVLAVLSPILIAGLGKVSTGVIFAPLLIGAGCSLALWSMTIFRLAD